MRSVTVLSLVLSLAIVAGASAKPRAHVGAASDSAKHEANWSGWPDTRAGTLARRWVEAFSKGEKAMREALPDLLTPESLAKRSMDERMESFRPLHDRLGTLTLVKVEASAADSIQATLAAADFSKHRFTFKVQTKPPYRLLTVSMVERVPGHMGGPH